MKNEVKISKDQLLEMIANWNYGAQPASIQYVTSPKINKAGKQLFGNIIKVANVGCILGFNYENSVNNQLERENKETDFQSKPIWNGKGKHITALLIEHVETGAKYLAYKYQQTFRSFHFDGNLNPLAFTQIKPFFYDSTPKNQGVNEGNEIHCRFIALDNIKKVKFRKTTYVIQ